MKIIDCKQGSPDWFKARAGIPTASNFDKIITPSGKPSKSSDKYLDECLAEWLAGDDLSENNASFWMQRGTELEDEAREQYEFITGETVKQVGFCVDGNIGCSPDGFVGDKGLVEIKCPAPATMVDYYRNGFPNKYRPQIHGQMWVTDRSWCDFFAYHPAMKPFTVRIYAVDDYINALSEAVQEFVRRLEAEKKKLKEWKID